MQYRINYNKTSLGNFNSQEAWIKYSLHFIFGTLHWGWYEFMTQFWLDREGSGQINALEPVALPRGPCQTSHGLSVNTEDSH